MSNEKFEIDGTTLKELLLFSQNELKRLRNARRWSIAFKAFAAVGFVVLAYFAADINKGQLAGDRFTPHIAYVTVSGPIATGLQSDPERLVPALQKAFDEPLAKAVVIKINSPGGSPVIAGRVYNEIKAIKAQHPDKPIYTVVDDLTASAAYWIACSTDEIYVDPASMIGSIGVISEGFGYQEAMAKVGIERRVMTSGENKALLDPYSPLSPKIELYWKDMLTEIHQQFMAAVKEGRGDRLNLKTPGLFSGLVWTGYKGIEVGLADKVGTLSTISRERLGKVNTVDYTPAPDFLKALTSQAATEFGAALTNFAVPKIR